MRWGAMNFTGRKIHVARSLHLKNSVVQKMVETEDKIARKMSRTVTVAPQRAYHAVGRWFYGEYHICPPAAADPAGPTAPDPSICGNRKNLRRDTTPELRITLSMRSKSGEKSCRRMRLTICSVNTAVLRFALPVSLRSADTQRLPSWEDTDIFHKSAPAKVRQRKISRFYCVQTAH